MANMKKVNTNKAKRLTKKQCQELYLAVAEGIESLAEEAMRRSSSDPEENPAHVRLVALAGFLGERGILKSLSKVWSFTRKQRPELEHRQ